MSEDKKKKAKTMKTTTKTKGKKGRKGKKSNLEKMQQVPDNYMFLTKEEEEYFRPLYSSLYESIKGENLFSLKIADATIFKTIMILLNLMEIDEASLNIEHRGLTIKERNYAAKMGDENITGKILLYINLPGKCFLEHSIPSMLSEDVSLSLKFPPKHLSVTTSKYKKKDILTLLCRKEEIPGPPRKLILNVQKENKSSSEISLLKNLEETEEKIVIPSYEDEDHPTVTLSSSEYLNMTKTVFTLRPDKVKIFSQKTGIKIIADSKGYQTQSYEYGDWKDDEKILSELSISTKIFCSMASICSLSKTVRIYIQKDRPYRLSVPVGVAGEASVFITCDEETYYE